MILHRVYGVRRYVDAENNQTIEWYLLGKDAGVKGDKSSFSPDGNLSIRVDGEFAKFTGVKVVGIIHVNQAAHVLPDFYGEKKGLSLQDVNNFYIFFIR